MLIKDNLVSMKFLRTIHGLNLAELIIAIVIMSLAVLTIIGMFMAGIMGMKKGDNRILALNLARSTMELYKDEILNNFSLCEPNSSPYTLQDTVCDGVKFQRKLYVKDFSSSETNKLRYVAISVYWYDKNMEGKTWAKPTEIKFSTYINNYLDYPCKH